jgi:hypothetical protein
MLHTYAYEVRHIESPDVFDVNVTLTLDPFTDDFQGKGFSNHDGGCSLHHPADKAYARKIFSESRGCRIILFRFQALLVRFLRDSGTRWVVESSDRGRAEVHR